MLRACCFLHVWGQKTDSFFPPRPASKLASSCFQPGFIVRHFRFTTIRSLQAFKACLEAVPLRFWQGSEVRNSFGVDPAGTPTILFIWSRQGVHPIPHTHTYTRTHIPSHTYILAYTTRAQANTRTQIHAYTLPNLISLSTLPIELHFVFGIHLEEGDMWGSPVLSLSF